MQDSLKLTLNLSIFEWACLVEAIDNYCEENGAMIDCSELEQYAAYIEDRLGLDKP